MTEPKMRNGLPGIPLHGEMRRLSDGIEAFDVTFIEACPRFRRVVLFAAGWGGNPSRHLPLLRSVAALGCRVIAPHFDRPASLIPTREELDRRVRRLRASAAEYVKADLPVAGMGHSLGTVALLALAGGEARTLAGDVVAAGSRIGFDRLALFAPPTDFFRHPGALQSVSVPIRIWVGARDSITPPAQAQFLKELPELQGRVELCLDQDAGHFSYMDELPPDIIDSHPDRSRFLAALANDVGQFIIA
jgi:pimeloyl-ACP methyl ester carboxylesterase